MGDEPTTGEVKSEGWSGETASGQPTKRTWTGPVDQPTEPDAGKTSEPGSVSKGVGPGQ